MKDGIFESLQDIKLYGKTINSYFKLDSIPGKTIYLNDAHLLLNFNVFCALVYNIKQLKVYQGFPTHVKIYENWPTCVSVLHIVFSDNHGFAIDIYFSDLKTENFMTKNLKVNWVLSLDNDRTNGEIILPEYSYNLKQAYFFKNYKKIYEKHKQFMEEVLFDLKCFKA